MSREIYLSSPQPVEAFAAKDGGMDIILRQSIEEAAQNIEAQYDEDGNMTAEASETTVYECEERQMHYSGAVTEDSILENFAYWWELAGGSTEMEAADAASEAAGEPTTIERLEAVEAAIIELAEVIANG